MQMNARSETKIHLEMNFVFAFVLSASVVYASAALKCPAVYLRLSQEHSFCKPPNTKCPIFHRGVTYKEATEIVDAHNQLRSKVAMGKETKAGGLPQAADMMQMVWDKELAAIAQKRAEQCIYAHDCSDCRSVESFSVGQNIAYRDRWCRGPTKCPQNPVPEWKSVIDSFYDEVSVFNKAYVNRIAFIPGVKYGHFTQIAWSRTWRIGCGFVAYTKENGYRHLYVCNYGPSGNMIGDPLYKKGDPCSKCPKNTDCGKQLKKDSYPGLCKMLHNNEAPDYPVEGKYLTYCDFKDSKGDCEFYSGGKHKWNLKKTLGGSYAEINLSEGQNSTLVMKKVVKPKTKFCLTIKYRSNSMVAGHQPSNAAYVVLEKVGSRLAEMKLPASNKHQFYTYNIDIGWNFPTKISVTFTVPSGAKMQNFAIRTVAAKEGKC